MSRNWIATVSEILRITRSGSSTARRRPTGLCIEYLEHRLSLSSYSAGGVVGPALNPQPLPPHVPVENLNPQPLPPHVPVEDLNPQPLPPHEGPSE
jgi:hypothetical protein